MNKPKRSHKTGQLSNSPALHCLKCQVPSGQHTWLTLLCASLWGTSVSIVCISSWQLSFPTGIRLPAQQGPAAGCHDCSESQILSQVPAAGFPSPGDPSEGAGQWQHGKRRHQSAGAECLCSCTRIYKWSNRCHRIVCTSTYWYTLLHTSTYCYVLELQDLHRIVQVGESIAVSIGMFVMSIVKEHTLPLIADMVQGSLSSNATFHVLHGKGWYGALLDELPCLPL